MLLITGNHSQRSHQSRPRVLCAFIAAQRRAFTDGAAESTRQRRLYPTLRPRDISICGTDCGSIFCPASCWFVVCEFVCEFVC